MAPSTSKRQKERRENRIAKKALLKEQKKNGSNPGKITANKKNNNKDEKIVNQITVDNLLAAAEHAANMDGGNPTKAIELYNATEIIIQQQQQQQQQNNNGGDNGGIKRSIDQYLDVLEKRAEQYLNIENPIKSLEDYNTALRVSLSSANDGGNNNDSDKATMLERCANFYMNIGQLQEGMDALASYMKGIESLEQSFRIREQNQQHEQVAAHDSEMQDDDDNDAIKNDTTTTSALVETKRKLASAYCAASELFMTDLCYNDNAEQECEKLIQKALQITGINTSNNTTTSDDSNNSEACIEALQLMASHRLSQNRGIEAIEFIIRAYELIRIGCEALSTVVGLRDSKEGAIELMNVADVQSLPSFEFRCQTVKILLECSNLAVKDAVVNGQPLQQEALSHYYAKQIDCVNSAIDVLGSLLAENDEVVEIWNLLGDAFATKDRLQQQQQQHNEHADPKNSDLPIYYWQRAVEMLQTVQTSITTELRNASSAEEEDMIQNQLDSIVCLMEEIQTKMEEFQSNGNNDNDDNDDTDDYDTSAMEE